MTPKRNRCVLRWRGKLTWDPDSSTLTWTGALAVGETVTIAYTATAGKPPAGDEEMRNNVTSNVGNCLSGGSDTRCRVTVPIIDKVDLAIIKTLKPNAPRRVR